VRIFCFLLICVIFVFLLRLRVGDALRQASSASSIRCPSRFVRSLLSLGRLSEVVPCHGEAPVFFTNRWPSWILGQCHRWILEWVLEHLPKSRTALFCDDNDDAPERRFPS
jgi:hypothetical protein